MTSEEPKTDKNKVDDTTPPAIEDDKETDPTSALIAEAGK